MESLFSTVKSHLEERFESHAELQSARDRRRAFRKSTISARSYEFRRLLLMLGPRLRPAGTSPLRP